MDQPSPERCASLKAHKSLPRKRVVSDELAAVSTSLTTKSRNSYTSPAKEAEITSWIRNASPPTPTNLTFALPLTPPEDEEEQQEENEMDGEAEGTYGARHHRHPEGREKKPASSHHSHTVSGSATPVNHYSPPTPELTPPRQLRPRTPSPALRRKKRISLSPPPRSRQTSSSKAESFRTALDGGSPRLTSASVNTFHTTNEGDMASVDSRARTPQQAPRDNIGLGLGLNEDDIRTPTLEVPTMVFSSPPPSDRLSASKPTTPNMVRTDPLVAADIPAVQALGSGHSFLHVDNDEDDIVSMSGVSYIKEDDTPYRERNFADDFGKHVDDKERARSDLSSRRSISPVSDISELDPLVSKAKFDSKRFSQVSASSIPQSIEVVIIDSSPPRKHKLRHASKNPSLRAASSTHGGSNRSSLQSSADVKPRLNQMLGTHAYRTTDSSLHSDSGVSMAGSDHIMKRWSRMQFMEIPRRRAASNTRSLPVASQRYISPMSSTYAPRQNSRPATAPNGASVSSKHHKGGSRTFSEASTLAREYEDSRRGRQKLPPAIPKRGSSLGAASRRVERAERSAPDSPQKAVAGNVPTRTHNRSVSQPNPQPQIIVQSEPTPEPTPAQAAVQFRAPENALEHSATLSPILTSVKSNGSGTQSPHTPLWMRRSSDTSDVKPLPLIATRNPTSRRSSKDDTALTASRSLLKTPFSGMSLQSSASGFYEVHEATAVNIYPHTNSSLLVIQQSNEIPTFPVHPGVRPDAYRLHQITSLTSASDAAPVEELSPIEETVHVTVSGPNGGPIITRTEVPVRTVGSPLRNPRPAPSPQKASYDAEEILPAVNLIPPTPLEDAVGTRTPTNKNMTLVNGPVSMVRRALSNRRSQATAPGARSSGLWLSSGRRNAKTGSIQKPKTRPTVSDNNLNPFWRPRRFWDDSDESGSDPDNADDSRVSEGRRRQFYQLGSKQSKAMSRAKSGTSAGRSQAGTEGTDYFGERLPIRNTLGFPQQRTVISGPASLVRRLSSIRRRRTAIEAAWADPKLNPSLRSGGVSPKPPATLPQPGAGSSATNLALAKSISPRASPSPSAMERRRKAKMGGKRHVRFEFNPMRGFAGGSAESKEWRTKGMVRKIKETREQKKHEKEVRELERIEKRRRELRGLIGRPEMSQEWGKI